MKTETLTQQLLPGLEVIDAHAHLGVWGYPGSTDDVDQLRRLLDSNGFSKVIVSSAMAIKYDVPGGNAIVARATEADERIYGSVVFNANYQQESAEEIERYADHPRFVSAKVHPCGSGLQINDAQNMKMIELLAEKQLPLTFHSWTGDGPAAVEVAERFPKLAMIWFHALAADYRLAAQLALKLPNVYLDYVTSTQQRGKVDDLVKIIGADRLLFGTDQTLFDPIRPLASVLEADISQADRAAILGSNARKIFAF
jgi:uncharacterized protein